MSAYVIVDIEVTDLPNTPRPWPCASKPPERIWWWSRGRKMV